MKGFSKSYALLATRFGSLDERLPDGTCSRWGSRTSSSTRCSRRREGDVFDLYAKRGASANAYTTFKHTAYLFSCTSRFDENLETLLDPSAMHADEKAIAREKGIIGQEIAMYDDDPSWRGYFGLLGALYRDHPIRLDPAGTKETIAPIDRDVLVRDARRLLPPARTSSSSSRATSTPRRSSHARMRCCAPTSRAPSTGAVRPRSPRPSPSRSVVSRCRSAGPRSTSAGRTRRPERPCPTCSPARPRPRSSSTRSSATAASSRRRSTATAWSTSRSRRPTRPRPTTRSRSSRPRSTTWTPSERGSSRPSTGPGASASRPRDVERAKRRALGGYLRTFNSPERAASLLLGTALKDTTLADAVAAIRRVTPARAAARFDELVAGAAAWSIVVPK